MAQEVRKLELPLRRDKRGWGPSVPLIVALVALAVMLHVWVPPYGSWAAFLLVFPIARYGYRISRSPFEHGRRRGGMVVVVLGEDGVQTPDTFVPWAKVRDLREYDDGAAIVTTSGDLIVVRAEDTLEFLREAKRFRAAGSARVAVRVDAMEWLEGETGAGREERLARYFGAGDPSYREGRGEPRELAELAADPAAAPGQRVQAARLLVRVEPSLVPRVREAAQQETANAELSEALLLAVGERGES